MISAPMPRDEPDRQQEDRRRRPIPRRRKPWRCSRSTAGFSASASRTDTKIHTSTRSDISTTFTIATTPSSTSADHQHGSRADRHDVLGTHIRCGSSSHRRNEVPAAQGATTRDRLDFPLPARGGEDLARTQRVGNPEEGRNRACPYALESTASAVSAVTFSAPRKRPVPISSGSRSTTSPTTRRSRTFCATTRSSARTRAPSSSTTMGSSSTASKIKVMDERDPAALGWGDLGVDVVLESTGFFTKRADAAKHLEAGREEGRHLRARDRRGHHGRARRELRPATTRTRTTSSPTRRARRTAWRRSRRSSTRPSASSTA